MNTKPNHAQQIKATLSGRWLDVYKELGIVNGQVSEPSSGWVTASSPLRDDGTRASFRVNMEHGGFKDFGGKGDKGDCFKLVQLFFGCDFKAALRKIAPFAGITLREPLGLTLAQYCAAKGYDESTLRERFKISDGQHTTGRGFTYSVVVLPYHDSSGNLSATRYRRTLKKAETGSDMRFIWVVGSKASTQVYGLLTIRRYSDPKYNLLILCEGESNVHAAEHHDLPALGIPGKNMNGMAVAQAVVQLPQFKSVLILTDPDAVGRFDAMLAQRLRQFGFKGEIRSVVMQQVLGLKDLSDLHLKHSNDDPIENAEEDFSADWQRILDAAHPVNETQNPPPIQNSSQLPTSAANSSGGRGGMGGESTADILVALAEQHVTLFHDASGDAFASLLVNEHVENWRLESKAFKRWLCGLLWRETRKAPNAEALTSAINVLSAKAQFEGATQPVAVRLAKHQDAIYLDLADESWRVVKITSTGWEVLDQAPVRFIRPRGVLALPVPVRGGTVNDLRPLVNVRNDADFALLISFLLAALEPSGPYPVLIVSGEQGSAKSTLCRLIRRLIDPNVSDLRAEPKEPRDLMIAANNGWIIGLDNISHIPPWLSDALCRLATGGGFACRQLYTDNEEMLFESKRPILINGIEDSLASRSDLLDRAIPLHLETIPEERRKLERELWAEFEIVRPRILGALLDALVIGLRYRAEIRLPRLPRMADFAIFATACERGLPWKEGLFLSAYEHCRAETNASALEGTPVSEPLIKFVEARSHWSGTSDELLKELETFLPDRQKKPETWPKTARGLSGILARIAPNLRRVGVEYRRLGRTGHDGSRTITLSKAGAEPSAPSASSEALNFMGAIADGPADGSKGDSPPPSALEPLIPKECARADDADGLAPTIKDAPTTPREVIEL